MKLQKIYLFFVLGFLTASVAAQTGQPEIGENNPVKLNDIGADQYIDIESLNYSLDNRGNIEAEVSFTSQVQNTVYTLQLGDKMPSYNMDGYSGYISLNSGDSYTEILEKHVTEFEGSQACIKGTEILDETCIDIQSQKDRWKEILSDNTPDISLTDSDSEITAEITYQDIEEMGSLGGYQASLRQENRNGQREIGPSNYNPPRYTGTVQKLLDKTIVSSMSPEDSIKTDKQTVTGDRVCVYVYGVNTGKCVELEQSRAIELESDEYSYGEGVQIEYSLRDISEDYYILTNGIDPESSPIYFDKETTELENTEGTVTVQTPQRGTGFQAWLIVDSDSVKGNIQGDISKDLIVSRDTATLSDNTGESEEPEDEPVTESLVEENGPPVRFSTEYVIDESTDTLNITLSFQKNDAYQYADRDNGLYRWIWLDTMGGIGHPEVTVSNGWEDVEKSIDLQKIRSGYAEGFILKIPSLNAKVMHEGEVISLDSSYSISDSTREHYLDEIERVNSGDEDSDDETVDDGQAYEIQISYGEGFEDGVGSVSFTTNTPNNNPKTGKWRLYSGENAEDTVLASSSEGTMNWQTLIYREEYCETSSETENRCAESENYMPIGAGKYTVKFNPSDDSQVKTKTFDTDTQETVNTETPQEQEEPGNSETEIRLNKDELNPGEEVTIEGTVPDSYSQEYRIVVKNPSGETVKEETKTENQFTTTYTPENNAETGEYTAEVLPVSSGLIDALSNYAGSFISGNPKTTFTVSQQEQPEWADYCTEQGFTSEDLMTAQKNCIENHMIPTFFQPESDLPDDVSPAESLCQDLLGYSYSRSEAACVT